MKYLPSIALLAATYVAITSNLQPINLLFGVLIAILVTVLVRPTVHGRSARQLATALVATLRYIWVMIIDLVVSGVVTARLLISPKLPIDPGVMRLQSNYETDLGAALSAHSLTLTPGEMVVEMDTDHNLYIHALDIGKAEDHAFDANEMRRDLLDKIFP